MIAPLAFFAAQPRRLLQLDAAGALVSALCLGVLLPAAPAWVGLSPPLLRVLAGAALLLVATGLLAARVAGTQRALATLAVGNASYAVATTLLLVMQRDALQWLGWIYFVLEIAVLAWLVALEWRIARMPSR